MNQSQLHVLVCPLDWGLGHASRCVPVIHSLLKNECKVSIAGSGRSLQMLKNEFPELSFLNLPSFSPNYSSNKFLSLKLFFQIPSFISSLFVEHHKIKQLSKNHNVDIVISDNRYGLWSRKFKSIIITHQLMLKMPKGLQWAEVFFNRITRLLLSPFGSIWIPDLELAPGLSGDLSHKYKIPSKALFVGILSRFQEMNVGSTSEPKTIDILAIISGAEPQRTIFEEILLQQLISLNLKSVLVAGKPDSIEARQQKGNLLYIPYLSGTELAKFISKSKVIVSRSGYSTIMDLAILNAKAIVVPTPGQTEQEYLAQSLGEIGDIVAVSQNDLNIFIHFAEALNRKGFERSERSSFLDDAVKQLIHQHKS